jgi:hypothetical protein
MNAVDILVLIFFLWLIVSIVFLIRKNYARRDQLVKEGTWITAKIIDIQQDANIYPVPGQKIFIPGTQVSYNLTARWEDPATRQQWTFRSSFFADRPKQYKPHGTIRVLVNLNDPTQYSMPVEESTLQY